MHTLRTQDRDASMTNTVSFHGVPMFRGLAFAIRHIEKKGAPVSIFSADRRDVVVNEHNRQFGTHLSDQQHLVDLFRRGEGNPANSPKTTSHCLYSDGNPVYRNSRGKAIPPGGRLPWYMLGIDLADKGKSEDVHRFLAKAHELGYHFVQPYKVGTEMHHVVCVLSPIPTLEHWNQISKDRHS